jgi:hypothetical protein
MTATLPYVPGLLLESAREGLYFGHPSQVRFEISLRIQLLFQPAGIVLPDSYIFSSCVVGHYNRADLGVPTVLDWAVDSGLLTILARGKTLETQTPPATFAELLSHMRSGGVAGPTETRAASELAARLDERHGSLIDKSIIRLWPRNMGKSFHSSFLAKLGLDDSAVDTRLSQTFETTDEQEQILTFHKRSASWREFALEAATEGDLRFSEVLKVAWRKLLRTPPPTGITFAMLQEALEDDQDAETNENFFSVLGDLQNLNFANAFNLQSERVLYCQLKRFYSDQISDDSSRGMLETESTARLPSVKRIIRWTPEFIAECRTAPSSPYPHYAAALQQWSAAPSDPSLQGNLLEQVARYADFIVRLDQKHANDELASKIKIEAKAAQKFSVFMRRHLGSPEQRLDFAVTVASVGFSAVVASQSPLNIPATALRVAGPVLKAAGQYTLSLWLHDLPVEMFSTGQLQVGHHAEDTFRSDI